MPAPRALCLLALLALAASAAAQPDLISTNTLDVKLSESAGAIAIEEAMKNELPPDNFTVVASLLSVIQPTSLRTDRRYIYRMTIKFTALAPACVGLNKKQPVTLTGSASRFNTTSKKNFTISETVDVRNASTYCLNMKAVPAGANAGQTMQMLVQKKVTKVVPLQYSWNLITCEKGKPLCYAWRLAPPCRNGRCDEGAGAALADGLFDADTPIPFNLTTKSEVTGVFGFLSNLVAKDKAGDVKAGEKLRWYFRKWQSYSGIEYDTRVAVGKAYIAFKQTILNINAIAKNNSGYVPGFSKFADMSYEDFSAVILTLKKPIAPPKNTSAPSGRRLLQSYPRRLHYGELNRLTPIRDQRQCGSCWAFAATKAIESHVLKRTNMGPGNTQIDMSEQEFVSCVPNGCNGGWMSRAFEFAKNNNLAQEQFWGYSATTGSCGTPNAQWSLRVYSHATTNYWRDNLIANLNNYGPVTIAVDASRLSNYRTGHFTDCAHDGSVLNHAVTVVGYDMDRNGGEWYVANSWGTGWGESGYFRMPMWNNDKGPCGAYIYQMYVTNAGWTSGSPAPAPAPPPSPPPSCFPAKATVQVEGGATKRMDELAIGDRVLAVDLKTGAPTYQPVYFFGHRLADDTAAYVNVHTDSGATLRLTPDHFLPVCTKGSCTEFGDYTTVPAHDVRPGQAVLLAQGTAKVSDVTHSMEQGMFNPYTTGGYIVVDGVVASAHSSWVLDGLFAKLGISLPAGYQAVFAPLRLGYTLFGAKGMAVIQALAVDNAVDLSLTDAVRYIAAPLSCAALSAVLARGLRSKKATKA